MTKKEKKTHTKNKKIKDCLFIVSPTKKLDRSVIVWNNK
jgi:hypothetical protein